MNINQIKLIIASDNIPKEAINPIINSLKHEDLKNLSKSEKRSLHEIITKMLILIQDPSTGAYLNNTAKAESLLSALAIYHIN